MIKAHNLLQTLTRVNRPYKDFKMGYIVDFANISHEFDKTNHAYFEELNHEYNKDTTDEDLQNIYGSLFVPAPEIEQSLKNAELVLDEYTTDNLEQFSQEINETPEKKDLLELAKTLKELKQYYNIGRLMGYTDLTAQIKELDVAKLLTIVTNRLTTLNLLANAKDDSSEKLLKLAMNKMDFTFKKVGQAELELAANDFMERQRKAAAGLGRNWDQTDPEWISLYDEFTRVLQKQHIGELSIKETRLNNTALDKIIIQINNLNARNRKMATAFGGDRKYARAYKHVIYSQKKQMPSSVREEPGLYRVMLRAKNDIDDKVAKNQSMVENQGYFTTESIATIRSSSRQEKVDIAPAQVKAVSRLLTDEYEKELAMLGV